MKGNAAALLANTAWLMVPQSVAAALRIRRRSGPSVVGLRTAGRAGRRVAGLRHGAGPSHSGATRDSDVLATGRVAPAKGSRLYVTVDPPTVMIGQFPADVLFSGLAPGFAGLYQINVRVPPGAPAGDEVALSVATRNGLATIAIRR